ncbi:MAG TPA: molybdenum cofactor guanylyltransferase [Candidatus Cybelea sp.]|jgi:molybdopterin-guanine dinucleotide biosynthesis protein A|nr:molybdenum cofactor guanylyltransferase [Candidatus Cybelea sp.]
MDSTAILVLAGGRARRFPGKLEHAIDGEAMLLRCYRRVRETGWPVYVAANGSFPHEIDSKIDAPMLIDRRPGRGPLGAFLDACLTIGAARLFAVAADQPRIDAAVLHAIAASWETGDEAVVPQHAGGIEPLAALYGRKAALREGFGLAKGKDAMRDLIGRVASRFVQSDPQWFHNVNRIGDLQ